ncbi:hypothetical protein Ciccas_005575 [Cichlidogyrus casuarinus]|uniref:Nesprin-1 n=1 Tax=Cichlidogyrus casuarinus TaxID=1844966 RepID=A0ABD2Q896_9PLAT
MIDLLNNSAAFVNQDQSVQEELSKLAKRFDKVKQVTEERLALHEARMHRHEVLETELHKLENEVNNGRNLLSDFQKQGTALVSDFLKPLNNDPVVQGAMISPGRESLLTSSILPAAETMNACERQMDNLIESILRASEAQKTKIPGEIGNLEDQLNSVLEESIDMDEMKLRFAGIKNFGCEAMPKSLQELASTFKELQLSLGAFKQSAKDSHEALRETHEEMLRGSLYTSEQSRSMTIFYELPSTAEEKQQRMEKTASLLETLSDSGRVVDTFKKMQTCAVAFNQKLAETNQEDLNVTITLCDMMARPLTEELELMIQRFSLARDHWEGAEQRHREYDTALAEVDSCLKEWKAEYQNGFEEELSAERVQERYHNLISWNQSMQDKLDGILTTQYEQLVEAADAVYPSTSAYGRSEIMHQLQELRFEIDSVSQAQLGSLDKISQVTEEFSRVWEQWNDVASQIKMEITTLEKNCFFETNEQVRLIGLDPSSLQTSFNLALNEAKKRNLEVETKVANMAYLDKKLQQYKADLQAFIKDPKVKSCSYEVDKMTEFDEDFMNCKERLESASSSSKKLIEFLLSVHSVSVSLVPKLELLKDKLHSQLDGYSDASESDRETVLNLLSMSKELVAKEVSEIGLVSKTMSNLLEEADFTDSSEFELVEKLAGTCQQDCDSIQRSLESNITLFESAVRASKEHDGVLAKLEDQLNEVQSSLKSLPERPSDLTSKDDILKQIGSITELLTNISTSMKDLEKLLTGPLASVEIDKTNQNTFTCMIVPPDTKITFKFQNFRRKLDRNVQLTKILEERWSKAHEEHKHFNEAKADFAKVLSNSLNTLFSTCDQMKTDMQVSGQITHPKQLEKLSQELQTNWNKQFFAANKNLEAFSKTFHAVSSDLSSEAQADLQTELERFKCALIESQETVENQLRVWNSTKVLLESFQTQSTVCSDMLQKVQSSLELYSKQVLQHTNAKSESDKNLSLLREVDQSYSVFRSNLQKLRSIIASINSIEMIPSRTEDLSRKFESFFDRSTTKISKNTTDLKPIEFQKCYDELSSKGESIEEQIKERIIAQTLQLNSWEEFESSFAKLNLNLSKIANQYDGFLFESNNKVLVKMLQHDGELKAQQIESFVTQAIIKMEMNTCQNVQENVKNLKNGLTQLQDNFRQSQGQIKESLLKASKHLLKLATQILHSKSEQDHKEFSLPLVSMFQANLTVMKQVFDLTLSELKERATILAKQQKARQGIKDWLNAITKQIDDGPPGSILSQKGNLGRGSNKEKTKSFLTTCQSILDWWNDLSAKLDSRKDELQKVTEETDPNMKMHVTRDLKFLTNLYQDDAKKLENCIMSNKLLLDQLLTFLEAESAWSDWWTENYSQMAKKGGLASLANLKDIQEIVIAKEKWLQIERDVNSNGKELQARLDKCAGDLAQEGIAKVQLSSSRNSQSGAFYVQLRNHINQFNDESRNCISSMLNQLPLTHNRLLTLQQQASNWTSRYTRLKEVVNDLNIRAKSIKSTWASCPQVQNRETLLPGFDATEQELRSRLAEFEEENYAEICSNCFESKKRMNAYVTSIHKEFQSLQRDLTETRELTQMIEVQLNNGEPVRKLLEDLAKESVEIGKGLNPLMESISRSTASHKSWQDSLNSLKHWLLEITNSTENLINLAGDKFLIESRIQRLEVRLNKHDNLLT